MQLGCSARKACARGKQGLAAWLWTGWGRAGWPHLGTRASGKASLLGMQQISGPVMQAHEWLAGWALAPVSGRCLRVGQHRPAAAGHADWQWRVCDEPDSCQLKVADALRPYKSRVRCELKKQGSSMVEGQCWKATKCLPAPSGSSLGTGGCVAGSCGTFS
eukprot:232810-Chlamydomonas_euryale.AAC.3